MKANGFPICPLNMSLSELSEVEQEFREVVCMTGLSCGDTEAVMKRKDKQVNVLLCNLV